MNKSFFLLRPLPSFDSFLVDFQTVLSFKHDLFFQLCLMALCLSSGSGIAIAKSQPESKADSDADSDAEGQYSEGKDTQFSQSITFVDIYDI